MSKDIQRLDGVEEVVTKEVNLINIAAPSFITLTGKPANQTGFKIVRDDTEKESTMTTPAARPRRIRPVIRSSLLTIEFPEGATEDDVKSLIEEYGLEGYEMVQDSDTKKLCLRRSDLTAPPENAISIKLGDSLTAKIARSAETPVASTPSLLPAIAVIAIEFKKENFTSEADAMAVIQRLDIDILEKGTENTDTCIRVLRSEIADGTDLRRVEVEPGVIAVIARADAQDLGSDSPAFVEVVCETCYGQYGWGQLDFNVMMADAEFCSAADDAVYRLRNLLDRILFYSELTIPVRKDLVARATAQFSAYVSSLLDALPTKVVLINRSQVDKKELEMTQKTETNGAEVPKTEAPITRAEVATLVTEAVAAALAAAAPAPVVRSEEAPAPAAKEEKEPVAEDGKVSEAVETITRSLSEVTAALSTVTERLTKMEGATIARSDGVDNAVAAPKKDVFAGVFSGKSA